MQVLVETTGPLERSLTVDVPEERIVSAVEERLKSMSKTSRVQGFRPGKAPMRVIKQRYGPQVRQEVVEKLLNSSFFEAVTQEDLKPAGRPLIDPVRDQVGTGLSYTATFEVMPEIQLNPIEDLQVEKPICDINEADIDKVIEDLRWQRREFREVARGAGQGDRVNIDYVGEVDGEVPEHLKLDGADIEIGEGQFFPGLEQGLEGAVAGQSLELDLTFPDDFINPELAGKPVVFKIQVNRVEETVLPELDEEFFEGFGVSEGGEQAFRQNVRKQMDRELETALRNRYRDSIMQALHEANVIDVPNSLVYAESERMREFLVRDMEMRGATREVATELVATQEYEETARRQVALQLLTGELIRSQELSAAPEKVREIIEARAQHYEDSAAFINWYYNDEKRLAEIEAIALEDEVIGRVSSLGKVTETALSFDELMNKGQTSR